MIVEHVLSDNKDGISRPSTTRTLDILFAFLCSRCRRRRWPSKAIIEPPPPRKVGPPPWPNPPTKIPPPSSPLSSRDVYATTWIRHRPELKHRGIRDPGSCSESMAIPIQRRGRKGGEPDGCQSRRYLSTSLWGVVLTALRRLVQ